MAVTLAGRATGGPSTRGKNNKDVSQREDLANFISMITRDETPFMSSIGKTKATAIYHEWQTDELQAPGNSRIGEGQDFDAPGATVSPAIAGSPDAFNITGPLRSRLGNYTQINGKTIAVSGTRRAVDQAGVADEYAYQLKKRGTEMRRDIEQDLVHSMNVSGAFATQTGAARQMGGYQAWINHASLAVLAAGSSGASLPTTANQGLGTNHVHQSTAGTAITRGSLALSDIDAVMQAIYEEGGKASRIMLSPKLRRDFSDLMVTDSGVRRNIDQDGKLRQSVDIYMSDFGDLMVVPNYIMGLANSVDLSTATSTGVSGTPANNEDLADFSALIYDPMWFNMASLRPMQEVDVGQKGDSTVGMMVEEQTLECRNPKGCGAIYALS
jgi:hypothetical protein